MSKRKDSLTGDSKATAHAQESSIEEGFRLANEALFAVAKQQKKALSSCEKEKAAQQAELSECQKEKGEYDVLFHRLNRTLADTPPPSRDSERRDRTAPSYRSMPFETLMAYARQQERAKNAAEKRVRSLEEQRDQARDILETSVQSAASSDMARTLLPAEVREQAHAAHSPSRPPLPPAERGLFQRGHHQPRQRAEVRSHSNPLGRAERTLLRESLMPPHVQHSVASPSIAASPPRREARPSGQDVDHQNAHHRQAQSPQQLDRRRHSADRPVEYRGVDDYAAYVERAMQEDRSDNRDRGTLYLPSIHRHAERNQAGAPRSLSTPPQRTSHEDRYRRRSQSDSQQTQWR